MAVESWKKFNRFIDAVGIATHEKHFRRSLRTLAEGLGFKWYAYVNIKSKSRLVLSNYPQEWQERYFHKSYHSVDPVIETAKRRKVPFVWSLETSPFSQEQRRSFTIDASAFDIRSGVTIPIPAGFGHMSMLTFASNKINVECNARLEHIPAITVASLVHAFVTLHEPSARAPGAVQLSTQEALCLRWAAEGKTMHETAALLDIKSTSVRSYLDQARAKLSAVNLIHAVAIATRLRLI